MMASLVSRGEKTLCIEGKWKNGEFDFSQLQVIVKPVLKY
jgi:hypothetical protein